MGGMEQEGNTSRRAELQNRLQYFRGLLYLSSSLIDISMTTMGVGAKNTYMQSITKKAQRRSKHLLLSNPLLSLISIEMFIASLQRNF